MEKACPVVLRERNGQVEYLAFVHPLAGKQFVKGTIEPGELLTAACERELLEESGLVATAVEDLGTCRIVSQQLIYGFYRMQVEQPIPETFSFFCLDDGGHQFDFFWQPLHTELDTQWHPIFQEIAIYLRSVLK
ncbi:NUDIX domain-containing protein [Reinekea sp. G2M2-21]|uniref:NUDIX domain-containing protein n=1 Tax=Reinekea sp. G2M2-21 TaxID=2788942 RepID=UPI0018AA22AA|nr:NUDIX domain-containing protein [Reinekea sp. G2M2-21]